MEQNVCKWTWNDHFGDRWPCWNHHGQGQGFVASTLTVLVKGVSHPWASLWPVDNKTPMTMGTYGNYLLLSPRVWWWAVFVATSPTIPWIRCNLCNSMNPNTWVLESEVRSKDLRIHRLKPLFPRRGWNWKSPVPFTPLNISSRQIEGPAGEKKSLLSFGAKPLAVHHQLEFGTSTCICFRFAKPHFQWIKKKTPPNPSAILRRKKSLRIVAPWQLSRGSSHGNWWSLGADSNLDSHRIHRMGREAGDSRKIWDTIFGI